MTESNAYEPIVQLAQVGSKILFNKQILPVAIITQLSRFSFNTELMILHCNLQRNKQNLTLFDILLNIPWPLGWPWPTWPLTLTHVTFEPDPCDPWPPILPVRRSKGTWDHVFWPSDLDPWPWPSVLTMGPSISMSWLLATILLEIWIIFSYFWSSPPYRQTESDAKKPTVQ